MIHVFSTNDIKNERFLFLGKYADLEWPDLQQNMINEYGPLVRIPAMLSSKEKVMITDPDDFELAFRTEGIYPNRRLFVTNYHYRTEVAPEKFHNVPGLVGQGEAWGKIRTAVNPVMLKPSTINHYIPASDHITLEFIERLKSLRDKNDEVPPDFISEVSKWAMETVSNIAFDTRLNVMGRKAGDPSTRATQFIEMVDRYFRLSYQLELKPSLWRYVATPDYKEAMKTLDAITEYTFCYDFFSYI